MHEERCGCLDIIIKAPQGGLGGGGDGISEGADLL